MAGHYTLKISEKQMETLLDTLPDKRPATGTRDQRRLEEAWNLRSDLLLVKKDEDGEA